MREIKFRAWDKIYKRMNYKVQVGNTDYSDQNYTCNSIWVDYSENKSIGWMNADDKCIDIMQYTGLKDKNGKEIYEGDVVIYETFSCDGVMYKDTYYVIYEAPMFKLKAIQSHIFKPGAYIYFDNNIEVIGNIYETPELLK